MTRLLIFILLLIWFHVSEYLLARRFHPGEVDKSSWLLSVPYVTAMACGVLEYSFSPFLWQEVPEYFAVSLAWLGFVMMLCGEIIRKSAILTAGHNFTHKIATKRKPEHRLCTAGVYSVVRHPAYLGFVLFSVGSQIWLGNVCCTVAFMIITWRFMALRIRVEDALLYKFFGEEWLAWKKQVPFSGIPGVP
ncbi:hypothetical protein M9435_003635 [Picochlorum sp. BPE23]|nr:hypothetical protein M9435_003635 [Picochlorum sp. BPE23]